MGSFVLTVEGDSLQMVSFRVKVWVTYIVFLSNGIFHAHANRKMMCGCEPEVICSRTYHHRMCMRMSYFGSQVQNRSPIPALGTRLRLC